MYASVYWWRRSRLNFYNDDVDMLPMPKPPRKPVKSKYETEEEHQSYVKEWVAKKSPPFEGGLGGHHMTHEYYIKQ